MPFGGSGGPENPEIGLCIVSTATSNFYYTDANNNVNIILLIGQ